MTTDRWCLHLWGVPRVTGRDGGVSVPLVHNDALWLAYVVSNAPVGSARVASLVWPEVPGVRAQNSLRQRLFRLRKATGARLVDTGETLAVASDLQVPAPPAESEIEADVAAWDQEFLAGVDLDASTELGAWLAECRRAWHERRRDALAAIASRSEAAGEIARALAYAQRLLVHDCLSEHAHRRLMRLHYLRGDRAAAVAAFEACERVLKDELGLKPDAETLALLDTFERSAAAALATRPPALPTSLLRPPRTVGREAAMQQLRGAGGGPRIALMVGEAGIGKTRLLQDFVAGNAPAGVAYAQARPGDAGVPYGALQRLLAALDAASPALAPAAPAAARAALAAAPARGVTTLVFDDLHFADRASIECLRSLVDDDGLAALHWVFAHRPLDAADEDAALLASLAEAEDAAWVALPPLAEAELGELVDSLHLPGADRAGLAASLWRHTGGNPLYALETLRAAYAPGAPGNGAPMLPRPQSIAHMIDRRLQRLSERALALGRVAAIAGADFGPALAEQALATPALLLAGAWAELEAADVLRGNAFAHDLVRDGMLRATPQPIAAHAHGQIAVFLEAQGAEPARVAAHWVEAGAHGKAGAAFLDAARRAQGLGRPREQARLLLQGAQAFDAASEPQAAIRARADAVGHLLTSEGCSAALAVSEALVESVREGPHIALCWMRHANALLWAGRAADCERAARHAIAIAPAADELVRLDATLLAAQACGLQGHADEGLLLMRPWDERIEHLDAVEQRIGHCSAYENLMIQADRPLESLAWTLKHLDFALAADDLLSQVTARMNLGAYYLRTGELETAIDHAQRAEAIAPADAQARGLARWNRNGLGYMLCGLGRFREGLTVLEAELEASQGTAGALRALQELWLADVMIVLGQLTRAHRLLDSDASPPAGMPAHKRLLVRAALARASGRDDAQLLEQARDAARRPSNRFEYLWADIELAARREEASERCAELSAEARRRGYYPLVLLAEQAFVQSALREQRLGHAIAALPALEVLARRYRYPSVSFPGLLLTCANAWAAKGDIDSARRCLTEAMYWVHSVALPNLPEAYREGFVHRNRTHLKLQAEFTRTMATPA